MQKDSPGKPKRGRNERYATAAQPKLLSLSSAKQKAAEFAAKDDKTARVGAKKAILRELNSHLMIRAQGILPRQENENPYGKQAIGQKVSMQSKQASLPPRGRTVRGREKGMLQAKEKKQPRVQEYTWNKDGRQHELRRRCLARKFLFLWIRNVYGKVHPHVARNHYNHKVKHHALQVWQDIWWAGRKGWKLNIRADYHNRYRTWLKVWKGWRAYVILKQVKKNKDKMAVQYEDISSFLEESENKNKSRKTNRALQARYIKVWIKYITTRRLKKQKFEMAYEFAVTFVKRLAFQRWMNQIEIKRKHNAMEHTAMQYWAYTLVAKCWSTWTSAFSIHSTEKAKLSFAEKIAKRKLLINVWREWMNYRTTQKLKAIQKTYFTNVSMMRFTTSGELFRAEKDRKIEKASGSGIHVDDLPA